MLYNCLQNQCTALATNNITSTLFSNTSHHVHSKGQVSYKSIKQHSAINPTFNQQSFVLETHCDNPESSPIAPREVGRRSCFICKADHNIFKCNVFRDKSPHQRFMIIKEQGRCINCFGNHQLSSCNSQSTCRQCHKCPHTLVHFPVTSTANTCTASTSVVHSTTANSSIPNTSTSDRDSNHGVDDGPQVVASAVASSVIILLSTALILILDSEGNPCTCRALIDNGS